jgi:hypothetical protein
LKGKGKEEWIFLLGILTQGIWNKFKRDLGGNQMGIRDGFKRDLGGIQGVEEKGFFSFCDLVN